jgi:outer membrane protein insertion porin family
MRLRVRCCFVVMLLLGGIGASPLSAGPRPQGAPPQQPQQPPMPDLTPWVGRVITSIRVEIEGEAVDNSSLVAVLEVRTGTPLVEAAVREGVAHLRGLGRYESVTLTPQADADGVALLFSLIPLHPINKLDFKGNTGLDSRSLERAVLESAGGRITTVSGEAAAGAVRRALADEGFALPEVTWVLERTHQPHASTLVLTIEAGARQRIGTIKVEGASPLTPDEVRKALEIASGEPYRRRALEDELRDLADGLRSRRYYEASANHFTTGEGDVVNMTVTVEAGPIFDIILRGDPLPDGGVDEWVPLRRENSADQDLLEDSALRIKWALQAEGYWRATVDVQPQEQPGGNQVNVTVTVNRGRRYYLRDVVVSGNSHFTTQQVQDVLAIETGDRFREDEILVRVQALLSRYGDAGFNPVVDRIVEEVPSTRTDGAGEVIVRLPIVEGSLRTVGSIIVVGARQIPEAEVRKVIRSQVGQPLRDLQIRQDTDAIFALYRNAGYESATVRVNLADEPDYTATFSIVEGPQTIVDHVLVAGNVRVRTNTILGLVLLKEGEPYGSAARAESLRRLNELAIFRRVTITAAPAVGEHRVDVIVNVEEAPATTIGYGGGLEFSRNTRTTEEGLEDRFEFAPRGFFEVGRRNLFGGNRSINLFSRVSLRPNNHPDDPARDGEGFGLSEYRVTGSYREAHAWRSNTDLIVTTGVERAIRTSFTYVRRGASAEALRRLTPKVSVFARYSLDSTRLFDTRISEEDQPLIDRLFPQIRLSSFSTGVVWDRRDNILDPTAGGWLSADAELAATQIGSEVGFAKTFMQATGFRRITRRGRVVLGARVQLGLARGFPRQVPQLDDLGVPVVGTDGEVPLVTVADLPAGRRFFAGGSTSVRGFQQDRLGVPDVLNAAGLSNGGNGLVIMNGEVRTRLFSTVSLVGFIDGGNVFKRIGDIRAGDFRYAAGFGLRYRSPLGPLRTDFGFKLDRRFVAGKRERGWEFHLSIGEAF